MPSLYLKVCFDLMFIILFSSFIHYTTQIELFSHTFFMPNGALNSLRTFVMLAQNGCLVFIWKNGQFSFQSQRRAMPKNVQAFMQFHMLAK